MRSIVNWMIAPALLVAAACGRSDSKSLDDGLQNDLSLASQVQPYQPQQFVSPMEQQYGPQGYPVPQQYQTAARAYPSAPVYSAPRTTRTSTVRRSSSGTYSSGRSYPAQRQPVRHTKRDAAIGATAGAVIGATTSRDKLKGAIIGAAAGGILGGIIGHTVDVQH